MKSFIKKIRNAATRLRTLQEGVQRLQEAVGRVEARQIALTSDVALNNSEFRVFSQWGEDGIIEKLVREVPITRNIFVEFGVENYQEANTRFLLINRNWSGLVLDSSAANIRHIRQQDLYWRYNLKAVESFVTRDNINTTLLENGVSGEIGLLSVDIDGNDYWVWESITAVNPAIVVVEYNARFGASRAVTVPYSAIFDRKKAHWSMIYYGASLAALRHLGQKKGYALVGCNLAGNNAFFVRESILPTTLRPLTSEEAFVPCLFREARDANGALMFAGPIEEQNLIESLPLVDVNP